MNDQKVSRNKEVSSESVGETAEHQPKRVRSARGATSFNIDALVARSIENLDRGLAATARQELSSALTTPSLTPEAEAQIKTFLSLANEDFGDYKVALATLSNYEELNVLERFDAKISIPLLTQLGNCYGNLNDYPKAIGLLNSALQFCQESGLEDYLGRVYVGLSRVYRKIGEMPIAMDHAQTALSYARLSGDWRSIGDAYHVLGAASSFEGASEKSLEYCNLGLELIRGRNAFSLEARLYEVMSGSYVFLHRAKEGVACLEKALALLKNMQSRQRSMIVSNNLGLHLIQLGDWKRAETAIRDSIAIATEMNHPAYSAACDSLGELMLMRGEFDESLKLLDDAIASGDDVKYPWFTVQARRTRARCLLALGRFDDAIAQAKDVIQASERLSDANLLTNAWLVIAEASLMLADIETFEQSIESIEQRKDSLDFFAAATIQRLRGMFAQRKNDFDMANYHFSRALTIFETSNDIFHTAQSHFDLGRSLKSSSPETASRHFSAARKIFAQLGIRDLLTEVDSEAESLHGIKPSGARSPSVSSQLLMLRLAEASTSRELLFRELAAVLQLESNAKKIIIAEKNENNRFYPIITQGFASRESVELIEKIEEIQARESLEEFSRIKNLAIFQLRAPGSAPALLVIAPESGATLQDGSSIKPLIRVVEIGLDVCALREKEKAHPFEHDTSSFASTNLMPGFIHSSPAMTELVDEVYKIRSSDVTVLVTGESGTGKELVSRAIHQLSNRKDKVFVPFNCTAVPKELAEGHLFGYKKGAFTGSVNDSQGVIRTANFGTLFLDEVGDLPIDVQPKLLRFLQEGEIQTLGEKQPTKVDVRVIAATNMHLEEKVEQGLFREDLYYRLNVIRLRVPPLRERRSEIPTIVEYYVNHYAVKFGRKEVSITPQAIDLLMVYDWPGNVRQLCNEIQRMVARAQDGEVLTPAHISQELKRSSDSNPEFAKNVTPIHSISNFFNQDSGIGKLEDAVSALESRLISEALQRNKGNISRVARELGLTRRGLYLKMSRYQLDKTGT